MSAATMPQAADQAARRWVAIVAATFIVLLLVLVSLGVVMRLAQAGWLTLSAGLFYQIMTAHGAGLVGLMGMGGAAVLWYALRPHAPVSTGVFVFTFAGFMLGAVTLLAGVLGARFAAGWTFLFPLPASSGGQWGRTGAAMYLGGLLIIGASFLVFFLDLGRAILKTQGSIGKALGWPQLFGGSSEPAPPAPVVAGTVVVLVNLLALLTGAVILTAELLHLFGAIRLDALFAKNATYFFGHTFINAAMYMAVVAVYDLLARATGRPWKVGKPFLIAWSATLVMVLLAYPHHLLMDFAMPVWALVLGQIVSYTSGLPVLLVTAIGALGLVARSGVRWSLPAALAFLAVYGWAAGVVPAILDATIVVNQVMHNTLWVPGHFHFYLILGTAAMIVAFALDFFGATRTMNSLDKTAFWLFAIGGAGFAVTFLFAGSRGVPRRWAVHLPEWLAWDRAGVVFGSLVLVSLLLSVLAARPERARA